MLLYYQNVNRIRSKLTDLFLNTLTCDFEIICLTETNLNSGFLDSELFDQRFNVFRRDRESSCASKVEGGGVLIAINKKFNVIRRMSWDSSVEDIWLTVLLPTDNKNAREINLCVCYLPPDLPMDFLKRFHSNCQKVISTIRQDNSINVILGDLTLHGRLHPAYLP